MQVASASATFSGLHLAFAAQDFITLAVIFAILSVAFFVLCWFLLSTGKVLDNLKPYLIHTCKFESLRLIRDVCQVNDMSMKNKLSFYLDGRMLILCHEPLPFAIGRRCWRIPIGELKPRDDAVYDFGISTPQGPVLCFFGQRFRSELKLFEGEQLRSRSLMN